MIRKNLQKAGFLISELVVFIMLQRKSKDKVISAFFKKNEEILIKIKDKTEEINRRFEELLPQLYNENSKKIIEIWEKSGRKFPSLYTSESVVISDYENKGLIDQRCHQLIGRYLRFSLGMIGSSVVPEKGYLKYLVLTLSKRYPNLTTKCTVSYIKEFDSEFEDRIELLESYYLSIQNDLLTLIDVLDDNAVNLKLLKKYAPDVFKLIEEQ